MSYTALIELMSHFNSEEKCIQHIAELCWPDGVVCQHCYGTTKIHYIKTRKVWWCGNCRKQFSVRVGTIFERTRTPLRKWFASIWLITAHKKRISSCQLAKDIGVTQKTAWFILQRIREVMGDNSDNGQMFGVVEIDETYVGGKEKNKHESKKLKAGRGTVGKSTVLGMNETFNKVLECIVSPQRHEQTVDDVRLILGDCRKILKDLNTNSVHLVLTDPPYFTDGLDDTWKKGSSETIKGTGAVGGLPVGMKFDPKQGKKLQEFMFQVSEEIMRVLVPGGFFLSFSQPRLAHRMAAGIEDAGFEIRDLYAWHFTKRAQMKAFTQTHFVEKMDISEAHKRSLKRSLRGRKTPQLRPQFEAIVMAQNPKEGTFIKNWVAYEAGLIDTTKTLDGSIPATVMKVEKPENGERQHTHLTPKPIKLLSHLIEVFSLPKQIVLDPFLGSGSTVLAAIATGRSCVGIEVNENYLNIAKKRIGK